MTCDIEGIDDSAQVAAQSFADTFAALADVFSDTAEREREYAKDAATLTEAAPLLYSHIAGLSATAFRRRPC